MSRNNTSSKQSSIKSNIQYPSNSWIFLLPDETVGESESQSDIVTLKHPNSGEPAVFLFTQTNNSVYEILTYSENKRSWFIDESVKSDGRFKICTPIDPVFLVLPYLRKYNDQAVPLDQILHDTKYPAIERLLKCDGLKSLSSVADKKGNQDIIAYKYNEEKTLIWLKRKVDNLSKILKQKNIHLTSDAISATYKKVIPDDTVKDDAYLRYAAGIVSDYLANDLSEMLFKFLNIPDVVPSVKRKTNVGDLQDSKKFKLDEELSSKNVSKALSKPVKTGNSKSKLKATSNTRSITAFFKKS